MVSPKELGLLKLEHILNEAIFISNKLYLMWDVKDKYYTVAKGIKSNSLSYIDFMKLLNDHNVNTAIKRQSKIHWDLGYVIIQDKGNIIINSNSYTKRDKIYNIHNWWLDTKPIIIHNIVKDLVVYKHISKDLIIHKNNLVAENTYKGFIFIKQTKMNIKNILFLIFITFILYISSVVYLLTLEEGDPNLDDYTSFVEIINNDKETKDTNIKVNNNVEIIVDKYS